MNIFIENLISRYPVLQKCQVDIEKACRVCCDSFSNSGSLFLCGNGGSASDADHISGELMKGFLLKREISDDKKTELTGLFGEEGKFIADHLQDGLPAVSLNGHPALSSAFANDVDPSMVFAQQLYVMGKPGDVVIGLSTSGNSDNILKCFKVAKYKNITSILLTGRDGGKGSELADISLIMPEMETYKIQELHLPVYHTMCIVIEDYFYGKK